MPQMHAIDYQVIGDDMQFVEVELDPEAVGGEGSPLGALGGLLDGDNG